MLHKDIKNTIEKIITALQPGLEANIAHEIENNERARVQANVIAFNEKIPEIKTKSHDLLIAYLTGRKKYSLLPTQQLLYGKPENETKELQEVFSNTDSDKRSLDLYKKISYSINEYITDTATGIKALELMKIYCLNEEVEKKSSTLFICAKQITATLAMALIPDCNGEILKEFLLQPRSVIGNLIDLSTQKYLMPNLTLQIKNKLSATLKEKTDAINKFMGELAKTSFSNLLKNIKDEAIQTFFNLLDTTRLKEAHLQNIFNLQDITSEVAIAKNHLISSIEAAKNHAQYYSLDIQLINLANKAPNISYLDKVEALLSKEEYEKFVNSLTKQTQQHFLPLHLSHFPLVGKMFNATLSDLTSTQEKETTKNNLKK